jgi:hypothetical protein
VPIPAIDGRLDVELLLDRLDGVRATDSPSNFDPVRYGGLRPRPGNEADPARDEPAQPTALTQGGRLESSGESGPGVGGGGVRSGPARSGEQGREVGWRRCAGSGGRSSSARGQSGRSSAARSGGRSRCRR